MSRIAVTRTFSTALLLTLVSAVAPVRAQVSVTPYRSTGIYDLNEKAGWTLTVAPGTVAPAAPYTYTVKRNSLDTIQTGTLDLSGGKGTIEAGLTEPGMVYVEVSGSGLKDPARMGAAIAPTRLQPSVPRPSDFDAFWNGKLAALREIPVHPVLTPRPSGRDGVDLSTVKLDSLGSHVQGFLARPAREGKFPALIIYQFAGVYALRPETVTDRAAEGWLAFDVDSHDLSPDQATGVSTDYRWIGNTDRETSYFLNMYLRDVRAIDYIAGRPDWDGKTIVVMGTSMGGQQSLVVAGLDRRITAVIVNEPAGADSNGDLHGRRAGYPNWPPDNPQAMRTGLYFDTVNFASRIQAPVLAAVGFIDTICPPVGIWIALNQIPGPKEVIGMVESDHNNITPEKQGAYDARSREVLNLILHGGEFRPR